MTNIVGILPMAGSGSRLGMPFHKSLAPTFDSDAIVPLYHHSLERLRMVCKKIYAVVPPKPNPDLFADLVKNGVLPFSKPDQGELPSSLRLVAEQFDRDQLMAVSLPDSIWHPSTAFLKLLEQMYNYQRDRERELHLEIYGVLGIFRGDNRILDEVTFHEDNLGEDIKQISLHAPVDAEYRKVWGWGIMLVKAEVLRDLTDESPLAHQLNKWRLRGAKLAGPYLDLGTQERYRNYLRRES